MEEGERVVKGQHPGEEEEEKRKREANQQNQQETEEMWSWGAGTEGQLGTGKLRDEHSPQLLIDLSNYLSSFGSISLLACGGAHVIALTSGGKVLSWGRGASGQLGHGEIVPNCLYPKLVDSLASSRISHVSAGWNHSGFVSVTRIVQVASVLRFGTFVPERGSFSYRNGVERVPDLRIGRSLLKGKRETEQRQTREKQKQKKGKEVCNSDFSLGFAVCNSTSYWYRERGKYTGSHEKEREVDWKP